MLTNIILENKKKFKENNIDENLAKYYYDYLVKENIYTKEKYLKGINKLISGIPIQYIIGNVDFYGNTINVNKNVLIPRFETEQLIEKTNKYINKYLKKEDLNIVDLGTGSGCIAISLKKLYPYSTIDAVDISASALKVAIKNAKLNNVDINFIKGNMLDNLNKKYDVIISNPPYISVSESIMDIVKNNEPSIALYAKNEGLEHYINILSKANNYLNKKNIIAFEIGLWQAESIIKIAKTYFKNSIIIKEQDYSNKDRFIVIINE